MAKIIGPGSLIVDVTGFAPHLPVAGETTKGSTLRFGPGGKGSNQMTAAHRAGSDVRIISCRGDDVLGQILKKHYETEGMSEQYVKIDPKAETASALIEIDESDAQNRIIVIFAANEQVGRENVYAAEADFADCDAVLTQFETTTEAVIAAKELAHKYGKPFILNPAPYIPVDSTLFDGVDFVTPNETEAEQFTGIKVDTVEDCRLAAQKFFEMGVKNVIITLGVRGAFYTNGQEEIVVPSIKVKAVETTGAGDAFNGGLSTAIAEGLPMQTALQFATCTAAISVTRLGSSPSMPYRHEILALLEKEFGTKL
ncbi:MAG: bifunctional hydroxymethylpyrimidine kinase/phosphomethylpyrimidine kinase [Clostridia bacterium]|nr:bifunctional hydroxymethylpyrimidine kinase/phosphomethylpyrimidine kinase [Clostridia bacterium]